MGKDPRVGRSSEERKGFRGWEKTRRVMSTYEPPIINIIIMCYKHILINVQFKT